MCPLEKRDGFKLSVAGILSGIFFSNQNSFAPNLTIPAQWWHGIHGNGGAWACFGCLRGCSRMQVEVRRGPPVGAGWGCVMGGPACHQSRCSAAQLLSVPICTCSFYSDPMSLSYQLSLSGSVPGPGDRRMDELWLDPNHLSAKHETDEFRW